MSPRDADTAYIARYAAEKMRSDRLRRFAQAVLAHMHTGGATGAELQALGVQHGLLEPQQVQEPCGDASDCRCIVAHGDETGWPRECYRPSALLTGVRGASCA